MSKTKSIDCIEELNFDFKEPFWRRSTKPLQTMLDDVLQFMARYQQIPQAAILETGILNELKMEFVFQMGRTEAEGVETLDKTKALLVEDIMPSFPIRNGLHGTCPKRWI